MSLVVNHPGFGSTSCRSSPWRTANHPIAAKMRVPPRLDQPAPRHPLPTHATSSSTDTTAPPHFTVFLILGCGFTFAFYIPSSPSAISVPALSSLCTEHLTPARDARYTEGTEQAQRTQRNQAEGGGTIAAAPHSGQTACGGSPMRLYPHLGHKPTRARRRARVSRRQAVAVTAALRRKGAQRGTK